MSIDHGAAAAIEILPVTGLPEFRPGDDLAAAIAGSAPWLNDDEAVRVLARKGRTLITENAIGLIQAAAGVDGSNVDAAELALLPVDPDGSAAALRARLQQLLNVTVG